MVDETRVYFLVVNGLEWEDQNSTTVIIGEKKKSERERALGVAHVPSNTEPTSYSIMIDEPLISSNSRSLHANLPSTNHVLPSFSACLSRPDTSSYTAQHLLLGHFLFLFSFANYKVGTPKYKPIG